MPCSKKAAIWFMGVGVVSGFLIAGRVCYAQTRIDLQVESLQIQPTRPTSKQSVELTASIRNNGSEPAENFYLSLEIINGGRRERLINNIPVLSRLPRAGSGLSVPVSVGQLPAGSYEVVATVDRDDIIPETNEANNQKAIQFQVTD